MGEKKQVFKWITKNVPTESQALVTTYVQLELNKTMRKLLEKNIKLEEELKELKNDLAQANFELLKEKNNLTVKGILELFEQKCCQLDGSRVQKYMKYVSQAHISTTLKAWKSSAKAFASAAAVFYEKVQDQQADAQAQGTTCIDVGNLSKSDQKILGILCKLLPLPLGILGYNNAELDTVINDLKVIKLE